MFELGRHGAYIFFSYFVTFVALGGLFAWIVVDHKRQKRKLSRFTSQSKDQTHLPPVEDGHIKKKRPK